MEEGFRLLLLVNEEMTPISQVSFGASGQLALFRIDDYTNSELYIHWTSISNPILLLF